MISCRFFTLIIFFISLSANTLVAQMSSKTKKYLSILAKRPSSDYLFDRFYNSWLEHATATDLEKYLDEKHQESGQDVYLQLKAYYYQTEGQDGEALDIYNKIISANSTASLLFRRGSLEIHTLEFDKAIADLNAALKKSP